jgi:hypothetical protein
VPLPPELSRDAWAMVPGEAPPPPSTVASAGPGAGGAAVAASPTSAIPLGHHLLPKYTKPGWSRCAGTGGAPGAWCAGDAGRLGEPTNPPFGRELLWERDFLIFPQQSDRGAQDSRSFARANDHDLVHRSTTRQRGTQRSGHRNTSSTCSFARVVVGGAPSQSRAGPGAAREVVTHLLFFELQVLSFGPAAAPEPEPSAS